MSRKLDPFAGVAIVVGSILGSGIFIAPSLIASFSPSLWVASALWIIGGLVCAAGAVIYGGLGLQYPEGGGQYVYLRESMSPRHAKFYGWISMLVICPTMLAGTSLFFTELCRGVFPDTAPYAKIIAVALLTFFTTLNTGGLRLSGFLQKFLVLLHVALFVGVVVMAARWLPSHELQTYLMAPIVSGSGFKLSQAIVALAAVLWSFEGFNTVTFMTNEIEGGERHVRRIALYGCAVVMLLYLIFNGVVFADIPLKDLVTQPNAASYLMAQIFGAQGALVVFALTVLGVATVLHSSIMIGPRVIVATIRDGRVFQRLARLDSETSSPTTALWFQCALAVFYVIVGHFEYLITAFIVLNWLFYGLTAIGFTRVRALGRLDQTCVALFLAMVGALILSQVLENPIVAFVGLVVFVAGLYAPAPRFAIRYWRAPEPVPVPKSPVN